MYPKYRIVLMGIVAAALLALFVVLYRTRLGMIVRAGIEDPVMVDSLGINVYRVFMVVFGIGAMAAGFAGIVNAPVASLTPDVGEAILVQTFVVVVIGGVGSFPGAILGGLIAGEIISLTSMVNPGLRIRDALRRDDARAHGAAARLAGTTGARMIANSVPARRIPGLVELLTAACLIAAPFLLPHLGAAPNTVNRILVWGLFGIGFDILFGYTGLLSFGQSALYGTGGMVAAYLLTRAGFPHVITALLIGMVAAAVVGYLVGLVALRRTGIYFAMITVAIAEVFYFVEFNPLSEWTGGENGLPGVPTPRIDLGFTTLTFTTGGRSIPSSRSATSSAS
jgi:ABC-type branched-subunit amino acid transport system permease subunit